MSVGRNLSVATSYFIESIVLFSQFVGFILFLIFFQAMDYFCTFCPVISKDHVLIICDLMYFVEEDSLVSFHAEC